MKVFISWSGEESRDVACTIRDWLPSVIQVVEPYVSSEDIDKGVRWTSDIAGELEGSNYGIICVTKDNIDAPWINFEAGALSKKVESSNVTPFLFGVKRSDVHGPLLQFQSAIFEKDDVYKLIRSINNRVPDDRRLKESALERAFEVWWLQLESALNKIEGSRKAPLPSDPSGKRSEILEEVLDLVRQQQRILTNPEGILPPSYMRKLLNAAPLMSEIAMPIVEARLQLEQVIDVLASWPHESKSSTIERIHVTLKQVHELLGSQLRVRRAREYFPLPLFEEGKNS
ncbi:TIR domain-containing protein [Verrucomicrobium sp. BvORR106]|uniref:TIR domain-containing protein n=1 Tax=Verrucomicrobium sp. BvORR106 TaxID=1403819 RepID=UPI00068C699F|nr:TIR domain-containing protein [Verrucomicrobium sp. BvORR106]